MILNTDQNAAQLIWQLGYNGLSPDDLNGLVNFFVSCQGRLHAFTFIDPADNMLAGSLDLTSSCWTVPGQISVIGGVADPNGGTGAFLVANNSQVYQEVSQTLQVPSDYQYCFSVYAQSATSESIMLSRQGSVAQESSFEAVGPNWSRLISSGHLSDPGSSFTIAMGLQPGQQVRLFGAQLEGQRDPSSYRPTFQAGGVYRNAHWAVDELPVSADGPNLFSTVFSIEATL